MKIIVTGSTGFIGKRLIECLSKKHDIIALTSNKNVPKSHNNVQYVACSMDNYGSLFEQIQDRDIDVCVHLAWRGNSGKEKTDYRIQINNVNKTIELINSLNLMGVKRFIGIGTLAEKEVSQYYLQDNSTPSISTLYGVCKLMAHMISKHQCIGTKIQHTWCSIANVYGPEDPTNNFVNTAMRLISSDSRASFTKGNQLYDLIYIDDLIVALGLVIESGDVHSEYYIGSGNPRPLREYIDNIRSIINPSKNIHLGDIPFTNVYLASEDFDISNIMSIGFKPQMPFVNGLKMTYESYLENGDHDDL